MLSSLSKKILSRELCRWLFCALLRILNPKRYRQLSYANICIYSACYGGYDEFYTPPLQTLSADVYFFGDLNPHSSSGDLNIRLSEPLFSDPRHSAKYFKLCPHEIPELSAYDWIVWVDSSCRIHSKFFLELLLMSISGNFIFMRKHPDRNSIWLEAEYSYGMTKYTGVDLLSQARTYLDAGILDDHLWHCALIVRSQCDAVVDFNNAWWGEMDKSLQDQISAPYAEFVSGVRVGVIPRLLNFFSVFSFTVEHRNHEYNKG